MRRFAYLFLAGLQCFVAIGAIPAGILFLTDTSGRLMGMNTDMLSSSPFHSYFVPALFLLAVNGFGNVLGAVLSFRKKKAAGFTGLLLGGILIFWIVFQIGWMGYISFLQPLLFFTGLLEAILGGLVMMQQRNAKVRVQ